MPSDVIFLIRHHKVVKLPVFSLLSWVFFSSRPHPRVSRSAADLKQILHSNSPSQQQQHCPNQLSLKNRTKICPDRRLDPTGALDREDLHFSWIQILFPPRTSGGQKWIQGLWFLNTTAPPIVKKKCCKLKAAGLNFSTFLFLVLVCLVGWSWWELESRKDASFLLALEPVQWCHQDFLPPCVFLATRTWTWRYFQAKSEGRDAVGLRPKVWARLSHQSCTLHQTSNRVSFYDLGWRPNGTGCPLLKGPSVCWTGNKQPPPHSVARGRALGEGAGSERSSNLQVNQCWFYSRC